MTKLLLTHKSDLLPGKIWPYIADFANIHRISPLIRRTTLLSAQSCGVGSERVCHMDMGMGLTERVVAWNEGESYSLDVLEMSAPIKNGRVTFGVKPSVGGSEIFMDFEYEHLFGWLGKVMDTLMTRPMMKLTLGWFLKTIDKRVSAGLTAPARVAALVAPQPHTAKRYDGSAA